MNIKDFQMWLHLHYESIRNTLVFAFVCVLVVFGVLGFQKQATLTEQVRRLSKENNSLSLQNKKLNNQTNSIVLQNRTCMRNIALAFADYTHNFIPVNIEDVASCEIKADGTSARALSSPQAVFPEPAKASSSQPNQSPKQQPQHKNTGSTGQPQPGQPTLFQRLTNPITKLLGGN